MAEALLSRVRTALPEAPSVWATAPGRINVIGEHTDYIDGLALPAAIDRHIAIGLHDHPGAIRIDSLDAAASTELDAHTPIGPLPPATADWVRYMVGSIAVFVEHVAGPGTAPAAVLKPFHAAVAGDVPRGAGLSSSAALTVAWMNALSARAGHPLDDATVVALARKVEHDWLGVACGTLDQTASQQGRSEHLLRVDFRTMEVAPVAVSIPHTWLVLDTGVRRGLAHSAYTDRVHAVTTGLQQLRSRFPGVQHWRDLRLHHLDGLSDPTLRQRLRHGITENARVDNMIAALRTGDLQAAGTLLNASHQSLRDDYAVSCSELDTMADGARRVPGVFGARMVGAGFGGCVLALAEAHIDGHHLDDLLIGYQQATGRTGAVHRVLPSRGAHRSG